ncbi:MAG: hypothetical protein ABI557_16870, partial [Aureliella sp.]
MRRIALGAISRSQPQLVALGFVLVLLAGLGWADEPAANSEAVDAPKSGVIIRLQLQPSTPEPVEVAEPALEAIAEPALEAISESKLEAIAEPKLEAIAEPEPAKIPATAVQFRRLPKGTDSSQSSRTQFGPLQRRIAQRRADATEAAPKGTATQPTATRQPASAKSAPTNTPGNSATADRTSDSSAVPGKRSILNDRPVLELSANPKSSVEFSDDFAPKEVTAADSPILELSPDEPRQSESQGLSSDSNALDSSALDSPSLELVPSLELNASSSDSMTTLDSDEGLKLDAPRSLILSDAGSANKDKAVDSDFSNERSLDSLADESEDQLEPDDVPLDQEPHPFDAPPAESIAPI